MKRWIAVGVLIAAAAIVVGWRTIDHTSAPAATDRSAAASAPELDRSAPATPDRPARTGPATAAPELHVPIHVTRLAPGERETIARRIADARAARAAAAATGGAPIPDHVDQLDLEHAPADLRAALDESLPLLEECVRANSAAPREGSAIVLMTLQSDPDVGTLVDPDQITDADGKPLDPKLSDCMRSTLSSIELPPLPQGQELPIQFTFPFHGT